MTVCEHIDCREEDQVLILTLNRPEKKNALTGDMYRALTAALDHAATDESIQVVLLTGSGSYFCAGNDVSDFQAIANTPYRQRPGYNFMQCLAQFPKPVVAALPGDAVGIGVTLLLHCDLVYLCQDSQLRLPFVNIGLVPEFASTTLLPQRLGHQRATELLFLRQYLDASDALAWGLANAVLPADAVYSTALESCRSLVQQSGPALQHSKRLMKQPQLPTIVNKIEQETHAINALLPSIQLPGKTSSH